jgi:uncharacterized protein (TIGR00661 family)
MSLNILYGVVGEGMGHATRSSVVIEELTRVGHHVKVVASNRAFGYLQQRFTDVNRIHGLHIVYDENEVQRRKTVLSNLVQLPENLSTNVSQYLELLDSFVPDVVISDFDSFAYLYAQNHNIPVISIDNMQILNRCYHARIPAGHESDFQVAKALVKSKLPGCAQYFITTFFHPPVRKERTRLVPPILRRSILDAQRSEGEHVVVYQTSESFTALLPALQDMKDTEFRVYGLNREEELGNVRLRKFSETGFVADLASARAVVANGGFSLMGEAVYLRKPMLSVPVGGQYEQVMNGYYLHSLGYGEFWESLDGDLVSHFLRNVPRYRARLESYVQDGNSLLFQALHEVLPRVAAREPVNGDPITVQD